MSEDKIYDKLKKLLRLAHCGTNTPEGESALLKAKELAVKHDIDFASVTKDASSPEAPEGFENVKSGFFGDNVVQLKPIIWILQNHFKVKIIRYKMHKAARYEFVGRTSDIVFATWLMDWLIEEFARQWAANRKMITQMSGVRPDTQTRKAFMIGCYNGLNYKLYQVEQRAKATASPETLDRYALMIVNEDDARDKAFTEFHPNVVFKTAKKTVGASRQMAKEFGVLAGDQINIPNTPLPGKSCTTSITLK